jgi:hypothetical protein
LQALVKEIGVAARNSSYPAPQSSLGKKLEEIHLEALEEKFKELGVLFFSPHVLKCMLASVQYCISQCDIHGCTLGLNPLQVLL